jgi:hypothetical protein
MSERKVAFTEGAARRVAAATLAYERGGKDMPSIRFRQGGGDDSDPVRLGRTTSTWTKGTTATIDIYENGTAGSETSSDTLSGCVNKFATVPSGRWVMVAKAGNGSWYLISAEC